MKYLVLLCSASLATAALADTPLITDVQARQSGDQWRFDVSILHPDSGWDHYADGWQVLAPDGTRLGYRELAHPHETEQPFTRSLSGVSIPANITSVSIQARCSVDGWTSEMFIVPLNN